MNLAETHSLLTFVAACDNRRFGDEAVIAWHGLLGDLAAEDCREAVQRHFRQTTNYLMPAHVRQLAMAIRDERRPHHEALALPSRFEADDERVQRVKAGIAECARALSLATQRRPMPDAKPDEEMTQSERIHHRALERARQERRLASRPHIPFRRPA